MSDFEREQGAGAGAEKDRALEAVPAGEKDGAATGGEDAGCDGAAGCDEAAAVPEAAADTEPAQAPEPPTEELGRPHPEPERTQERPLVDKTAPRPAAPQPQEGTPSLGGSIRGRLALLGGIARRHRAVTAALALMACAVVALLGIAFVRAATLPDAATVQADARALLDVPEFSGGTFGTDTPLVTQDVEVRSLTRAGAAPEGAGAAFGAAGYATAEVVITYGGQSVSATRAATLSYALVDGTWSVLPGVADGGVAWHATGGVDQEKVLRNTRLLLERTDGGEVGTSLADLYADAGVTIESATFDEDEQTDTLELSFARDEAFLSYACHLTVTFSFAQASGQWSVAEASVADGARTPNLDSLLGTWEGAFQSQQTDGTKCLAGRSAGLTLKVIGTSVSDSAVMLSGELSGLAHYHAHPGEDSASCDGDLAFEAVAFQARLSGDGAADGPLEFVATLPEDVDGTVTLTLRFGTEDDPSRVEALVETLYPTTETVLFIPYERTVTYTDAFTLTHAE